MFGRAMVTMLESKADMKAPRVVTERMVHLGRDVGGAEPPVEPNNSRRALRTGLINPMVSVVRPLVSLHSTLEERASHGRD